jgi:hypothetical protein
MDVWSEVTQTRMSGRCGLAVPCPGTDRGASAPSTLGRLDPGRIQTEMRTSSMRPADSAWAADGARWLSARK